MLLCSTRWQSPKMMVTHGPIVTVVPLPSALFYYCLKGKKGGFITRNCPLLSPPYINIAEEEERRDAPGLMWLSEKSGIKNRRTQHLHILEERRVESAHLSSYLECCVVRVPEHCCAVSVEACAPVPLCCLTAASQAEGIRPRWMDGGSRPR